MSKCYFKCIYGFVSQYGHSMKHTTLSIRVNRIRINVSGINHTFTCCSAFTFRLWAGQPLIWVRTHSHTDCRERQVCVSHAQPACLRHPANPWPLTSAEGKGVWVWVSFSSFDLGGASAQGFEESKELPLHVWKGKYSILRKNSSPKRTQMN